MLLTLIKCLRIIPKDLRWYWLISALLSLLTAALETATAGAIYLLVKLAGDPSRISAIPLVSALASFLPGFSHATMVFVFASLFALFHLCKAVFTIWAGYARELALGKASVRLSTMFFRAYMTAPYSFHLKRNSSELIHHVNDSIGRVLGGAMAAYVNLLLEVLVACGLAGAMLVAAPTVTVTVGALVGLFLFAFLRLTRAEMVRSGAEAHRLSTMMLKSVRQGLGAIKEIKVLGREQHFLDAYDGLKHEALRAAARRRALAAVPRLGTEAIFAAGGLSALALYTFASPGGENVIPLLAIYAYGALRLLPASSRIPNLISDIHWSAAPVDRLYEDCTALLAAPSRPEPPDIAPAVFADRIVVENLQYAYDGAPGWALQDVNLVIHRGESVGIVGPTGAGKTTLVDLIIGLAAPQGGRITIDGRDLQEIGPAWRRQIGYVPQTIYLVDDSIRRNVALGLPDDQIDEQRLWSAVRMANLEDVVRSLPLGLEAGVGERGLRLSGGQRQRIGIARALYHNPAVLVFDEATSALDSETEADVIHAIEALQGEKTLIVIAHRLSTVRRCQRLVFLRDGRIQVTGRFDELLRASEEFRTMARLSGLAPTVTEVAGEVAERAVE